MRMYRCAGAPFYCVCLEQPFLNRERRGGGGGGGVSFVPWDEKKDVLALFFWCVQGDRNGGTKTTTNKIQQNIVSTVFSFEYRVYYDSTTVYTKK